MPTARDLEQLWHTKSDDELLEAASALGEYTPEGQHVIRGELRRRGFEDPVEQKGESALEATAEAPPPRECIRCRVEMKFLGSRAVQPAEWSASAEASEFLQDGATFDLYLCPECAQVEMFLNLPIEDASDGADDTDVRGES